MAAKDKRNTDIVEVRDLNGKIHKMARPNATDMVAHLGWTLVFGGSSAKSKAVRDLEVSPEQMKLAHSERVLRPRDDIRLEAKAKEEAAALSGEAADDVVEEAPARPKRQPRTKAKTDDEGDGIAAVTMLRPVIDGGDDLAALENEEAARVPRDE